jgi:hypothetical protein
MPASLQTQHLRSGFAFRVFERGVTGLFTVCVGAVAVALLPLEGTGHVLFVAGQQGGGFLFTSHVYACRMGLEEMEVVSAFAR